MSVSNIASLAVAREQFYLGYGYNSLTDLLWESCLKLHFCFCMLLSIISSLLIIHKCTYINVHFPNKTHILELRLFAMLLSIFLGWVLSLYRKPHRSYVI